MIGKLIKNKLNDQLLQLSAEYPKLKGTSDLQKIGFLLKMGADIHAVDACGRTALHRASNIGHLELACYLVEHGADIDLRSNSGESALIEAISNNHLKVVKYLVSSGADINYGGNAMRMAISRGNIDIIEVFLENNVEEINKDALNSASQEVISVIENFKLKNTISAEIHDNQALSF